MLLSRDSAFVHDSILPIDMLVACPALSPAPAQARAGMHIAGYDSLAAVLQRAYNQAAIGKGVERHASAGEPFDKQIMQIGAAKFGTGALLFQAFKKSEESQRLPHDRAVNELLGAIVYLAGAVIALDIAAATAAAAAAAGTAK